MSLCTYKPKTHVPYSTDNESMFIRKNWSHYTHTKKSYHTNQNPKNMKKITEEDIQWYHCWELRDGEVWVENNYT